MPFLAVAVVPRRKKIWSCWAVEAETLTGARNAGILPCLFAVHACSSLFFRSGRVCTRACSSIVRKERLIHVFWVERYTITTELALSPQGTVKVLACRPEAMVPRMRTSYEAVARRSLHLFCRKRFALSYPVLSSLVQVQVDPGVSNSTKDTIYSCLPPVEGTKVGKTRTLSTFTPMRPKFCLRRELRGQRPQAAVRRPGFLAESRTSPTVRGAEAATSPPARGALHAPRVAHLSIAV